MHYKLDFSGIHEVRTVKTATKGTLLWRKSGWPLKMFLMVLISGSQKLSLKPLKIKCKKEQQWWSMTKKKHKKSIRTIGIPAVL